MRSSILVLTISILSLTSNAQLLTKKYVRKNAKVEPNSYSDSAIHARGLLVDGNKIFFGNNNGGIYYYNTDKNKSDLLFQQPGFPEVRDIEVSNNHYVAISSGEEGKVLIIEKSGAFKLIQLNEWKELFIDGIDFIGKNGFMMGDPSDSLFNLFRTFDGGYTWERCPGEVKAFKDEAGFAASGTNVQMLNDSTFVFISGGMKARFFKSTDRGETWTEVVLPYYPGKSTGPYSLCFANDSIGVMVGGDYKDADIKMNTTFYTDDGGESWINPDESPGGYRSCAYYVDGVFYCCGRNGIDYSTDGGIEWHPFAEGRFFSLSSQGNRLIATSLNGKFYTFELIEE